MHWQAKQLVYSKKEDWEGLIQTPAGLWSQRLWCYVVPCEHCKRDFYSVRPHAKTCGAACRKAKSRATKNAPYWKK
jgi:hypothetical protein